MEHFVVLVIFILTGKVWGIWCLRLAGGLGGRPTPSLRATPPEGIFFWLRGVVWLKGMSLRILA
ncbi:MAG: hypothetical protein AAFP07_15505 [Cyanobacteria bacterium J06606_4]